MGQPKSGSSTVAPSPAGVTALNQVLPQVQQYLSPTTNPYHPVMLQTAEQNPTQVAAAGQYSNAYGAANTGLQTYGQASDLIQGAAQPLTQAEINQYFNPYVNQVVGATEQQFNLQNAQQQNQVVGNEAAQGALGGNRTAVAGALTAGQQATAEDPIIAGMLQAGYTQQEAMAAQQYQQVPLAAASALQGIGAGQEAAAGNLGNLALGQYGLGTQQQQYNTGAQAGTLGASTAQDIALLQEQMARYGYPIQLTNMAAGDVSGLSGAYGSNTTTTPPPPSLVSGLSGLGILGIGAGTLFSKRGGRIQGLQTGGVPAMPYGASPVSGLGPIPYAGGGSYIPQVGATNFARPPAGPPMAQPQDDSSNMFMNALKLSEMGSKSGSGGAGLLTNTSLGDTIGDTMQDWTAGADAFPAGTPGATGGRVPRAYGGLALPSSNRINVPTRGGLGMPSSMVMRRDAGGSADMSDTSTAAGTDVPPLNPMMANITYGLYGEAAPYGAQGMAEGGTPKDDIAPDDTVLVPDETPPPEAPVQVAQGPSSAGVATDAPEIISTGVSRRAPEDPRGKVPYIRETAKKYGIDPNVAVNVARSEGLGTFTSGIPGEKSFGAFQLNTQGGMGNEFYRDTGLDPSDPRNENATIDYALRKASTGGWGPFHGAKNRYGYSNFAGINGNDGTQALALSEDTSGRGLGTTSPDTGGIPGVTPIKAADISGKTKPDKTDIALSIMAAGLGMMGSRSPYAGVGIGQGGLQGLAMYEALHKQRVGEAEHQATLEQQAAIANNATAVKGAELAETKRYHNLSVQEREDALAKTMTPGMAQHPDGNWVPGYYQWDPEQKKSVFHEGIVGKQPTGAGGQEQAAFERKFLQDHGKLPEADDIAQWKRQQKNLGTLDTGIVNETENYPDLKGKAGSLNIDKTNQVKVKSAFQSSTHLENIAKYTTEHPGAIGLLAKASNQINLDAYKDLLSGTAATKSAADMEKAIDAVGAGNVGDVEAAKVINKMLITQAFNDASASGQRGGVYLDKVFRDLYQQASSPKAFFGILGQRYEDANNTLKPYGLGFDKRSDKDNFPFWERLHGHGAETSTAAPQRKFSGGKYYIRGPNGEAVLDPNQSP